MVKASIVTLAQPVSTVTIKDNSVLLVSLNEPTPRSLMEEIVNHLKKVVGDLGHRNVHVLVSEGRLEMMALDKEEMRRLGWEWVGVDD